jgi:Ca2+ transporting ATPase
LEEEKFSKGGSNGRTNHDLPSPVLLSGTQVQTGEGLFMVIVCGKMSCVGKIMSKLATKVEQTPLQIKLEVIATDIGKLGMIAATITVLVLFLRFFIEQGIEGYNWADNIGDYIQDWFEYIIIGITIVVVAVPEGLPLAVMISLAYSVRKMLKDKNFVKRLSSCEIMGGANNICSDKTGTLTKNEMTVTNFWQNEIISLDVEKEMYTMSDHIKNEKVAKLFLEGCACNTTGTSIEANATEKAILKMLDKFSCDYQSMRSKHLVDPYVRFQFTSRRKKMSSILTHIGDNEYNYDKRLHVKGAAEIVLGTCSHYLDSNGNRAEMSQEMKDDLITNVVESFAKDALRTICMAYKDLKEGDGGLTHEDDDEDSVNKVVEKFGLTCIVILGIRDIIRPEVPEAVDTCQRAGIKVRMVTGDNKVTALAIAKQCRIIADTGKENSVLEGPEFYDMVGGLVCDTCKEDSPCNCDEKDVVEKVKNKEVFRSIWKNLNVLARSRPEDKYLLVTGIREFGDVVAVTGDGTNDAPALKKADVGFAMGITGTDVAKHAADIILLDDNFASIVKACMWGRNIYDNIRRFLQFQLTVNVVALISAFVGSCLLRESPLQPIQLLWVNLIMDSLASLALATEPPKPELLERPPYSRDEYIISRKMIKHILIMSIYQSIVVFVLVFAGEKFIPEDQDYEPRDGDYIVAGRLYDWDGDDLYQKYRDSDDDPGSSRQFTVVFTAFVLMQIFNMLNARKIHDELNIFTGLFGNSMMVFIWITIMVLQILITQFTREVFEVSNGGF